MRGRSGVGGFVVASLVAFMSMGSAWAGNTQHPRTPVLWPDAPCIATVDRSVDPLFAFDYAIPAPDTLLSVDEFDDSRTHQFIGFCRQWPSGHPPPRYVSVYDLERAIAAGFEQVVELGDPEATLETSVAWAGCWTRITADDARRPITFEAAAEPVIWDTSTLLPGPDSPEAPGTWLVAGYTWEPPLNMWSRTPWVVRVTDGAAPPLEPVQAAAAMLDGADSLYFDESLEIGLCVDASAGSSVTLEWVANKAEPFEWAPIATVELSDSGSQTLSLPFVPPEPSWGKAVLLRASVEQPQGPSYAAHALASVLVFTGAGDGDGDGDGDTTGDGDGDADTTESGGPEDESGETGDTGTQPSSGRCSVNPERGNLPGLGFGLGVLLLARRRR